MIVPVCKAFELGTLRIRGRHGTGLAFKVVSLSDANLTRSFYDEPRTLDSRHDSSRSCDHGPHVGVRHCLRKSVKGALMIVLAAIVTLLLFIYLLAALLRPEWF